MGSPIDGVAIFAATRAKFGAEFQRMEDIIAGSAHFRRRPSAKKPRQGEKTSPQVVPSPARAAPSAHETCIDEVPPPPSLSVAPLMPSPARPKDVPPRLKAASFDLLAENFGQLNRDPTTEPEQRQGTPPIQNDVVDEGDHHRDAETPAKLPVAETAEDLVITDLGDAILPPPPPLRDMGKPMVYPKESAGNYLPPFAGGSGMGEGTSGPQSLNYFPSPREYFGRTSSVNELRDCLVALFETPGMPWPGAKVEDTEARWRAVEERLTELEQGFAHLNRELQQLGVDREDTLQDLFRVQESFADANRQLTRMCDRLQATRGQPTRR